MVNLGLVRPYDSLPVVGRPILVLVGKFKARLDVTGSKQGFLLLDRHPHSRFPKRVSYCLHAGLDALFLYQRALGLRGVISLPRCNFAYNQAFLTGRK
jgi:hypothetical protein